MHDDNPTDRTIEEAAQRAVASRDQALAPEDERAIQRLIIAYGLCSDFALIDEIPSLFVSDAVWDGREFRFPVCRGHEEIQGHFAKECRPGMRQVHIMEPPLLWADGDDGAEGLVQFSAMQAADGAGVIAAQHAFGMYVDRYRRTDAGWKIEHRTLRLRLVRR